MTGEKETADPQRLLDGLLTALDKLRLRDGTALDKVIRRTDMLIRNVFGTESKYLNDLKYISFSPSIYPTTTEIIRSCWEDGCGRLGNMIRTMKEQLALFGAVEPGKPESKTVESDSVFIVHGHDETMKLTVARTIEKLGLSPVILHEKPNRGRTIIEKFADYASVGFAVVLLSPDDVGQPRTDPQRASKTRARQNVIFELGYFIGRLGRERVVALYKQEEDFEFPSDYSGVLYVPYDAAGRWQFDVLKELKAVGYDVDANKLVDSG